MKYNQDLNYQKRQRFLFRVRVFSLMAISLLLLIGAYGYYAIVSTQNSNTEATSTSQQTSSYFASSVKVFRSPFFQFQADNNWAEVPNESTQTKFVYRSLRANLIEHELVVYVNQIPDTLAANRVLPANPKGDSELLPISVSGHCGDAVSSSQKINKPQITFERVSFRCIADSTNYTVLVGLVGKSSVLDLLRPDGTTAKYSLFYSNLKATPDGSQLVQITESFQAR